jgi:hypothetical protein
MGGIVACSVVVGRILASLVVTGGIVACSVVVGGIVVMGCWVMMKGRFRVGGVSLAVMGCARVGSSLMMRRMG